MNGFDFSVVLPYAGILAQGAGVTILISAAAALLSMAAGLALAIVALHGNRVQKLPFQLLTVVFMGTPLLLQLFVLYYGLVVVGIDIPAVWAGIIGLGLHFAVYNADVFRAGLSSIDRGQTEAARSIGFTRFQTLRHFIIPQALNNTAPAIGSNMVALLKESAVVSVLGIAEVVQAAQRAISETFRPFEFYIAIAVIYYLLNVVLEFGLRRHERKAELYR